MKLSRNMTKPTKWVCAHWSLRSAWAESAQADLSLCRAHTDFVGFVMSWLSYVWALYIVQYVPNVSMVTWFRLEWLFKDSNLLWYIFFICNLDETWWCIIKWHVLLRIWFLYAVDLSVCLRHKHDEIIRCRHMTLKQYCKFHRYSDTQKICCNHTKIWTMWLCHRVMSPNDADGMANSVDPDQTAPLGAVWSGSALFCPDLSVRKLRKITYEAWY